MTNLWLVQRSDIVSHDEYESWIVRAKDEDHAALVVWDTYRDRLDAIGYPAALPAFRKNLAISRMEEAGTIGVVHSSFIAG